MDSTRTDPQTATSTQEEQARCQPAQTYVWTTFDRSDWMGQQRPNLQGRRLLDLRLCGSHDTGTYSIVSSVPFVEGGAVTQNAYLQDQLGAGLRYVNLRPGSHGGNLVLAHGTIWGSPFSDFVSPIPAFCQAHPNEFLIVFVEKGNAISQAQKQQLVQMLTGSWGPLMVTSNDAWFDLSTVTMGDIWNPQVNTGAKRLLVLIESSLLPSTLPPASAMQQGFWTPSDVQTGGWAAKSQWNAVSAYVTAQLQKADDDKLFLAQLILTPGGPGGKNVQNMTGDAQDANQFGNWWAINQNARGMILYTDFSLGAGNFANPNDVDIQNTTALLDSAIWYPNPPWYAIAPALNWWAQNLEKDPSVPFPSGSPWQNPNGQLRYGVSFVDGQGVETAVAWLAMSQYYPWALANLNVPIDPGGRAQSRNVYRQFLGANRVLLGTLPNNTATTFQDNATS